MVNMGYPSFRNDATVFTHSCVTIVSSDAAMRERIATLLRVASLQVMECARQDLLPWQLATGLSCDVIVLHLEADTAENMHLLRHVRQYTDIAAVIVYGPEHGDIEPMDDFCDARFSASFDEQQFSSTVCALVHLQKRRHARVRSNTASGAWHLARDGWMLHTPDGHSIALSDSERRLLSEMVTYANDGPIPYEALILALAADIYAYDPHRLEMLVHRLRKKAALATSHPLPLRAVRAQGYLCDILPFPVEPCDIE